VSRHAIVNILLGVVAAVLVAAVIYLRVGDGSSSAATTTIATTTTSTTVPPTTTDPPTTTTIEPPTTVPATTAPPTTSPPTTLPPADRAVVPVVVTSAGLSGERVGPSTYLLSLTGWTNTRGVNGVVQVPLTTIYYADGFQNSAELMAADMALPVTQIAPLASAPPVAGLGDAALLVYFGDA
jgi:hypothetical protein